MTELKIEKDGPTRRGVALHTVNPFIFDVTTKTRRITNKKGDMELINKETGEVHAAIAGFWESEEVDSTKFVKLFVQGVKALKELSGSGTKMFEVMYQLVQESVGRDRIYISFSSIDQALTPMSEATYTRGMRELVEKKFIAATTSQGLFWLNPSYVWNGDRLAFVKEYRKKSDKSDMKNRGTGQGMAALEAAGQQRLEV